MINNSGKTVKNISSESSFEIGNATKKTDSSGDGKKIGLILIGQTAYIATYADSSTPANPIVKIGDYEISVNDVNPKEATEIVIIYCLQCPKSKISYTDGRFDQDYDGENRKGQLMVCSCPCFGVIYFCQNILSVRVQQGKVCLPPAICIWYSATHSLVKMQQGRRQLQSASML